LNPTEQSRIIVLNHLASGALVNAEAAQLLGISKRNSNVCARRTPKREWRVWPTAIAAELPTTPSILPSARRPLGENPYGGLRCAPAGIRHSVLSHRDMRLTSSNRTNERSWLALEAIAF